MQTEVARGNVHFIIFFGGYESEMYKQGMDPLYYSCGYQNVEASKMWIVSDLHFIILLCGYQNGYESEMYKERMDPTGIPTFRDIMHDYQNEMYTQANGGPEPTFLYIIAWLSK
jgi:hypothetical protein